VRRPKKQTAIKKKKKVVAPASGGKKTKGESVAGAGGTKTKGESKSATPPNKILFVTNLPEESNEQTLRLVFQPFIGLKDIRQVPNRTDIAFVEFESEAEATTAKKALNNFKITPNHPMKVEYANK